MGTGTWLLLAATLAVAAVLLVQARRHPILARLGARNALRRPRQTLTVVAGLMVGTAIISSALVAGDSAGSAIRGYVYQSLGHIDESVALEGYPFYPESVYDDLRADADVRRTFDGMAAHAIWEAAVDHPSGTFEPSVGLVGYEPERDAAFGLFETRDGPIDGRGIQRGQAILTSHLANSLGARPGDTLHVTFTPPQDPMVPELHAFNGTLAASVDPLLPVPVPQPAPQRHTFEVGRSAMRIVAVAAPGENSTAPPPLGLRLRVIDPQGNVQRDATSPGGAVWANVTSGAPDRTLEPGTWALEVSAPLAANQPYLAGAIVLTPVYDLETLRDRARAFQGGDGGPGGFPGMEGLQGLSPFGTPRHANLNVLAVTTGGRGDLFDFRDAAFIHIDEAQELFGREGQVNLVKLSNRGGVASGVHGTDEALRVLNATLEDIKADHPDVAAIQSLEAHPVKREFLEVADTTGQTLTGLLVFAGSLSIVTGLLLITNIFTMLAEERRSELGMARAVGMTRGHLVRMFVLEGGLYAVGAAAAGALLGLALAYGMVEFMNAIVANLSRDLSFPAIEYRPSLGAVLLAFSVGSLLTFATLAGASRRASRLNVVRAIRRIEEPERRGSPWLGWVVGGPLLALGLAATTVAWWPAADGIFGQHRFSAQVFAPLVAVVGAGIALRPWFVRRRLDPVLAGLLAAYEATTFFLIRKYDNLAEANVVGPLRGVILTLAVVVVVVHLDPVARGLGRLLARLRRLRGVAAPALSYPLHRKFRTGMTVAMFSLVILSIGFFSIFGALFQTDPARQTGGFDIEARTTLTVQSLEPYDRGLVAPGTFREAVQLAVYETEDPDFITVEGGRTGNFGGFLHHAYGFGPDFVEAQDFRLLQRLPGYASDEAAYQGVLDGDGVIVGYMYSTDEANRDLAYEVGDTLEMHLGDEVVGFPIVGIQEQYHFPGIFLPRGLVEGLFPTTEGLHLYTVRPGVDVEATARLLEQNYREVGMDARDAVSEVEREQESFRQILGALKLFLGLGLVVGVLSLGIVTSRSVLERRQEIGMLRALGFQGRDVRRVFFVEVTFTLLLGALVGLACAILVTYGLWFAIIRQLHYPYVIPWGEVALLVGVSYLVALLATWAPMRRASRVPPAEALRYVE